LGETLKNLYAIRRCQWKLGRWNVGDYIARMYQLYETKIGNDWKLFLIKVRENESPEHAFLCWYTESLLSKKGLKLKINASWGADLELEYKGKKICFEIETGKRLDRMKRRDMYSRFVEKAKTFDSIYIVVPTERVARRYRGFGYIVITKARLEAFILSFLLSHNTQGGQNACFIVF
jgi:hypothetical protein